MFSKRYSYAHNSPFLSRMIQTSPRQVQGWVEPHATVLILVLGEGRPLAVFVSSRGLAVPCLPACPTY